MPPDRGTGHNGQIGTPVAMGDAWRAFNFKSYALMYDTR